MKSGIQGPDAGRFPFPERGGLVKGGMAPWRRPRTISSHASVFQVLRIMAVREALDLKEDDRNVQDLYHWRLAQRHCGGLWIRFPEGSTPSAHKGRRRSGNRPSCPFKKDGRAPPADAHGRHWCYGETVITGACHASVQSSTLCSTARETEGWQSGLMRLSREQEARKRPGVRIPHLPSMERCPSGLWCALGERME